MASSKVRSIQGEEQGELIPNRRAKFSGMSINELAEELPFGASVSMTVMGTVTGEGRERRADGTIIYYSKVQVTDVAVDKISQDEPEPTFDDLTEG